MGLFSKPRFKWKEPLEFMKKRDELTNREGGLIVKMAVMGFVTGLVLLVWWVNYIDPEPGKNPPTPLIAIPLSLFAGWLAGFISPKISRNEAHTIKIYDEGIMHGRGSYPKYDHWKELIEFGISESEEAPFLWLKTKKGRTSLLGIDESIDLKELAEFLEESREQTKD